jgi:hypothetical protein
LKKESTTTTKMHNINQVAANNNQYLYGEYNSYTSIELTMHAQELVQESTNKTAELYQFLRYTVPILITGEQNAYLQRTKRIEELLFIFENRFQRLRVIGNILNQRKLTGNDSGSDNKTIEPPTAETEEKENKEEEESPPPTINKLTEERDNLRVEIRKKNNLLKYNIDKINEIIWQINAMQNSRQ